MGVEHIEKAADFKLSIWNWVVIFCKGKFGDGLTSVFEYILNIFNTKVLSKVSPAELKKYSALIVALAEFGEKILNIYIMGDAKKTALSKTVDTLRKVSVSMEDGKVTAEELEQIINDLVDTIEAWKNIRTIALAAETVHDEAVRFVPGEAVAAK